MPCSSLMNSEMASFFSSSVAFVGKVGYAPFDVGTVQCSPVSAKYFVGVYTTPKHPLVPPPKCTLAVSAFLASSCSASCIFLNVGSPSMGVMESVLNFALMSLSLTFGMVGMYVSRPDARRVMFGLIFCDPAGAEPDVAG